MPRQAHFPASRNAGAVGDIAVLLFLYSCGDLCPRRFSSENRKAEVGARTYHLAKFGHNMIACKIALETSIGAECESCNHFDKLCVYLLADDGFEGHLSVLKS